MFNNQQQKDLYDKFDCMATPNMSEFDIIHFNRIELIDKVKKLCYKRKFKVFISQNKPKADKNVNKIKFKCSYSPYYINKGMTYKWARSCPFHCTYIYNEDEEEYYLGDYDEMHNHVLTDDPRIMPMIT